ncbi:MAG: hypothetical protein EB165_06515 [Euryarchaeota archaeon]|nr:hypothetical protein [Euryarchaeota archaeon]
MSAPHVGALTSRRHGETRRNTMIQRIGDAIERFAGSYGPLILAGLMLAGLTVHAVLTEGFRL